ncbi:MAG: SPOR domain-containing protein [Clostridia bacterium]|nr:SPOR domain-containing protein [Clostridia bacterium]
MELRRRRGGARHARNYYTSRTYSRRKQDGEGGLFGTLLLLILTAALVYILVATPVGSWLAGSVLGIGKNGKPESGITSPLPSLSPTGPTTDTNSPQSVDTDTKQFELKALETYALQIGVFDTADSARSLISTLKSLGAAGYALSTDEGIRVIASSYPTEAAASSVSKRLNEQGYQSVVYPIALESAVLTCTSDAEKLKAVETACSTAGEMIDLVYEETIRFDGEERGVDYGNAVVRELLEKVRAIRTSLDGINDDGGVIACLDEYYLQLTGALMRFLSSETDNRVELSGRLKYLEIEIIDHYKTLLSDVLAHKT